jgi:beta-glucosidase
MVGASSADIRAEGTLRLTGPLRTVGHERVLTTPATVERAGG